MCSTLFDELGRCGVRHVVVAPGSRSTPLALAALADETLAVHVHHDERAAGFMALGIGVITGTPAAVVTTSGTAVVNLHPAVVEADAAGVPLIVLSSDRPAELRDVASPQTIDQADIFGRTLRWFHDPGVPEPITASTWRSTAARAVATATGPVPGPVQLNLPFREPLVGDPSVVASPLRPGAFQRSVGTAGLDLAELPWTGTRGVIVTDDRHATGAEALAGRFGWPIIAGARSPVVGPHAVTTIDALLRIPELAERFLPDVVVRLGEQPASRFLSEWTRHRVPHVQVGGHRWVDPGRDLAVHVPGPIDAAIEAILALDHVDDDGPAADPEWLAGWQAADAAARSAVEATLTGHPASEPAVARAVVAACPSGGALMLSSSMPIRDVEWYGGPRRNDVEVLSNRGANGIDGVVSTAVGAALGSGRPVTVLVGDVAMLHDTNALLGLAGRDVDVKIAVVDNDGGGIFSFLPQAKQLDAGVFETLFGTPHGVDIAALAAVHGLRAEVAATAAEVAALVADRSGPEMVVIRTDRAENVDVHAEVHDAVRAAVLPCL